MNQIEKHKLQHLSKEKNLKEPTHSSQRKGALRTGRLNWKPKARKDKAQAIVNQNRTESGQKIVNRKNRKIVIEREKILDLTKWKGRRRRTCFTKNKKSNT